MPQFYILANPEQTLFVHYNEATREYFLDDKLLGAVVFTEKQAKKMLKNTIPGALIMVAKNHVNVLLHCGTK